MFILLNHKRVLSRSAGTKLFIMQTDPLRWFCRFTSPFYMNVYSRERRMVPRSSLFLFSYDLNRILLTPTQSNFIWIFLWQHLSWLTLFWRARWCWILLVTLNFDKGCKRSVELKGKLSITTPFGQNVGKIERVIKTLIVMNRMLPLRWINLPLKHFGS